MNLQKHIIDTIKEWQLKIGYREGNMKLYYPGDSLVSLLGLETTKDTTERLVYALTSFCDKMEPELGRIKISGSYERFCLDIPPKGCAYVAKEVQNPEFLRLFLDTLTKPKSTMEKIRECFADYATTHGSDYVEEVTEDIAASREGNSHSHAGHVFYFVDETVDEYIYWIEENAFGLTYHRFTRTDYEKLK